MTILIDQQDNGVTTLSLNRPEVRNALNPELIQTFTKHLKTLAKQENLRLLVIKGVGKSFCAGADLTWFAGQAQQPREQVVEEAQQLVDLLSTLSHFPTPTLAVLQGHCYGGGLGLAACADIVISADNTAFCFSEAKWGLVPATIAPYVYEAIGKRQANYLFHTALPFSAAQACDWGLVHQVTPADQLQHCQDNLINQLISHAGHAQRAIKTLETTSSPQFLAELLQHPDTQKRLAHL